MGTGTAELQLAAPEAIQSQASYEVAFDNPSLWQNEPVATYRVQRVEDGAVLQEGVLQPGLNELAVLEGGWVLTLNVPEGVSIEGISIAFTDEQTTYTGIVQPASVSSVVGTARYVPLPADFELHFTETFADTSLRLALGMRQIPAPFYIENVTTGKRQPFILVEDRPALQNGQYDHGDLIILVMGETPESEPQLQGGALAGFLGDPIAAPRSGNGARQAGPSSPPWDPLSFPDAQAVSDGRSDSLYHPAPRL